MSEGDLYLAAKITNLTEQINRLEAVNQELVGALEHTQTVISGIRYSEWPTIGLGIMLSPEELDDALEYARQAIAKATNKGE